MRRTNRNDPSSRRRRKGRGFQVAAVDEAWDARIAYRDWLDEIDQEPASLAELLADEYGIDPADLDGSELFDSFVDAMEAEVWEGYRRTLN